MVHYFDNNATTAVVPEAVAAMEPYFRADFGNPSSPHILARRPALAVASARASLAELAGVAPDQLVFTSGGTEGNALAVWGWLRSGGLRDEVVVSAVEHASVLAWHERLAEAGYTVRVAPVVRSGALDLAALAGLIGPRTALVSVMLANNETGVVYPVKKIAEWAHAAGARMHTDAAQAIGRIPVHLAALGVDAATGCAHKMHGPKGVGFLYLRDAAGWRSGLMGGGQEFGRRPGTEPVSLIAGFGAAADQASAWLRARGDVAMAERRDAFEAWVVASVPGASVIGRGEPRLPNTSLLWLPGRETEVVLAALDMAGVACSSGSACASGAHEPSHVLAAMGWAAARGAVVRISAGRMTTDEDYAALREAFTAVLARLPQGS
ncbi:MAG TPA: cysteine desulfurase family protein [Kiritimatiellia bacterium]|nr:cysteine desulfurase family protein [Kiritimatiellia bacterium]HMP34025.1 cysteine desulfurase family protein [Kiritimatiellia bacterium]